jgi:hypothetical protein
MHPANAIGVWTADWLWGLLLITASLVMHAIGLGLIAMALTRLLGRIVVDRHERPAAFLFSFATVVGLAALLLAILHGIEAMLWAAAYVALGAMPNIPDAVYFSLAMMSTSGTDVTALSPHWKLMGTFEAVGGMLLFGLSTAFLFAVLVRMMPITERDAGGQ